MPVGYGGQVKEALDYGQVGNVGAPDLIRGGGRPVTQQIGIGRNALTGYTQVRFRLDRLVAHQTHQTAHPFLVDGVAGQAQMVAQAHHALEVVLVNSSPTWRIRRRLSALSPRGW